MNLSKSNWEYTAKNKAEKRQIFLHAVKCGVMIGAVTTKGIKPYRSNDELLICYLSGYGLMTLPTNAPHLAITKPELMQMISDFKC